MELAIHWSPTKVQRVLALVNIAVECTHLCGSPDKFPGPEASVDGNWVAQCEGEGGVAFPEYWMIALPHEYTVYVSPPPPYLSISWALMCSKDCGCKPLWGSSTCECQWYKLFCWGVLRIPPFQLPSPQCVKVVKQYQLPRDHKEISAIIWELER